jgi:hypothetical protein
MFPTRRAPLESSYVSLVNERLSVRYSERPVIFGCPDHQKLLFELSGLASGRYAQRPRRHRDLHHCRNRRQELFGS